MSHNTTDSPAIRNQGIEGSKPTGTTSRRVLSDITNVSAHTTRQSIVKSSRAVISRGMSATCESSSPGLPANDVPSCDLATIEDCNASGIFSHSDSDAKGEQLLPACEALEAASAERTSSFVTSPTKRQRRATDGVVSPSVSLADTPLSEDTSEIMFEPVPLVLPLPKPTAQAPAPACASQSSSQSNADDPARMRTRSRTRAAIPGSAARRASPPRAAPEVRTRAAPKPATKPTAKPATKPAAKPPARRVRTVVTHVVPPPPDPNAPPPEELARAFTHTTYPTVRGSFPQRHGYEDDIYGNLAQVEVYHAPRSDYLDSTQPHISAALRATVIDWMHLVGDELRLHPATVLLAVHVMDRFLSIVAISSEKLQLIAMAAILIAGKYEEVRAPTVHALLFLAENVFPRDTLIRVEPIILSSLEFAVSVPSALDFLHYFASRGTAAVEGLGLRIAEFLVELSSQQPLYFQHRPSAIAATALCIARYILATQGHHMVNLCRLQRLRDAFREYYTNQHCEPDPRTHPIFKAYITIDALPQELVAQVLADSWGPEYVTLTRYRLSTLASCIASMTHVLICGMGYGANEANPFPVPEGERGPLYISEDTLMDSRAPRTLRYPRRDTFTPPAEPVRRNHVALADLQMAALPLPRTRYRACYATHFFRSLPVERQAELGGEAFLHRYKSRCADNSTTDANEDELVTKESFKALPDEQRRVITAHSIAQDLNAPIPLAAFFGRGYAITRRIYNRYADQCCEHIAQRFIPPMDLKRDVILSASLIVDELMRSMPPAEEHPRIPDQYL